ncbi:polyphosphate kinase [Cupriavidus basilensis OR16]|uniref:Polyphosphate kinase n=1 Tax=Cupriavidus basilensis OR16 TaxID=1127483 RepID=H1RYF9_9BURK|nr:polyphosphate kinase [Cupriavidus basilensis OR16]
MAIKQTVYRAGNDSALLEALIGAARRGKEVSVVVELLARFDEQANINWAAQLEEAGAHVVYGVVGYKAHAKMALVVRREGKKLRRYAHIATGNYHSQTARSFTDFGLFTCKEAIVDDVANVFSQLTGLGHPGTLAHFWQSPFTMHTALLEAIRREGKHARAGRKGLIIAKMNALLEPKIIDALYQASCDGARIELFVRGACALRPGIPGLSEKYPGALRAWPVPGTCADLLLLQRQGRGRAAIERRLDGPRLFPAYRGVLPRAGQRPQGSRDRGRPEGLPEGQPRHLGNGCGRQLPAQAGPPARIRAGHPQMEARLISIQSAWLRPGPPNARIAGFLAGDAARARGEDLARRRT